MSGVDVKDALLESGLPQPILAHIWKLCDIKETGNLNSEQFALARFLIKQKQNGLELPIKLLPNMIPPTLRPKPTVIDLFSFCIKKKIKLSNYLGIDEQ